MTKFHVYYFEEVLKKVLKYFLKLCISSTLPNSALLYIENFQ